MEKRGLLSYGLLASIFFINLVSAYGSYGYFSFGNFINSSNPLDILAYGAVFLIIFALINLSLGRSIFKDPITGGASSAGNIVSAALSFLIMYYAIYKTNFNLTNLFSGFGLSTSTLYPIFGFILLIGAYFIIRKTGLGGFLILAGAAIIATTVFTDWIYEKGAAASIGAILLLIGLWRWRSARNRISGAGNWARSNYSGTGLGQKKSKYQLFFAGILVTIAGATLGIASITYVGIGLTLIGLLWWLGTRRRVQNWATSPIRNRQMRGAEEAAYREHAIREAEAAAHRENAEREALAEDAQRSAQAARVRARRTADLQNAYDRSKRIYHNARLAIPARQAAAEEMQRLAQIAVAEGLRIRY